MEKEKYPHARETRFVRAASIVWARFGKEEEGGIAVALLTDDDAAKTCPGGAGHVIRNGPPVQLLTGISGRYRICHISYETSMIGSKYLLLYSLQRADGGGRSARETMGNGPRRCRLKWSRMGRFFHRYRESMHYTCIVEPDSLLSTRVVPRNYVPFVPICRGGRFFCYIGGKKYGCYFFRYSTEW